MRRAGRRRRQVIGSATDGTGDGAPPPRFREQAQAVKGTTRSYCEHGIGEPANPRRSMAPRYGGRPRAGCQVERNQNRLDTSSPAGSNTGEPTEGSKESEVLASPARACRSMRSCECPQRASRLPAVRYERSDRTRNGRLDTDPINRAADYAAIADGTYETSSCKVEPPWYANDPLAPMIEKRRARINQDRRTRPSASLSTSGKNGVPMSRERRDAMARRA